MQTTDSAVSKRPAYFLLIALAVIWGSSFIIMKRGLITYTPIQIGCLRMFSAAVVMSPFLIRSFKTVQPSHWKYLLATGLFGNAIPSILFPLAQHGISSSLAGMINTLTPIFTLLLGALVFGMTVTRNRVVGLLLGLVGAVILIGGGRGGVQASSPVYAAYVVAATVCYAISVNILRHKLNGLDPLAITSFALLFIGVPMGAYLFTTDFVARTLSDKMTDGLLFPAVPVSLLSFTAVFFLGVVGTAISTVMFNKLIQRSGALVASSVTYLIPVVAAFWGFADGESIGMAHAGGLTLILSGVYIINLKK